MYAFRIYWKICSLFVCFCEERCICFLQVHPIIFVMRQRSQLSSMTCLKRIILVTCMIWHKLHCNLTGMGLFFVLQYSFELCPHPAEMDGYGTILLWWSGTLRAWKNRYKFEKNDLIYPSGFQKLYATSIKMVCVSYQQPEHTIHSEDLVWAQNSLSWSGTTKAFLHYWWLPVEYRNCISSSSSRVQRNVFKFE